MSDATDLSLYGYGRSSASYRVRIALAYKGLAYTSHDIDVRVDAHRDPGYLAVNPAGLIPALVHEGQAIGQSLAILEYLEERFPEPALLPRDPILRAHARALALDVACDIHPLQNLRVLKHVASLGHDEDAVLGWFQHWVECGLSALEARVTRLGLHGPFMLGAEPCFADLCLVPQMYNARRRACDLSGCPTLVAIDAHCQAQPAFDAAKPA